MATNETCYIVGIYKYQNIEIKGAIHDYDDLKDKIRKLWPELILERWRMYYYGKC